MKKSLLTLLFGALGIGMTEFVMMGILLDIASSLNVSIPKAGYLIAFYAFGVVVGAPLLALAGRKVEAKKLLIFLMLLFTCFNALSIVAPTYCFLLASRFFSGLPHGAFLGVGSVVATRLAAKGKESQAISVMFSGMTIANLIGVPLGTFIGHHYTWRYTFVLITLIGVFTIISLQLWMPLVKVTEHKKLKEEVSFFLHIDSWLLIAMIAVGTGGFFSWISYVAPLLTQVAHFNPGTLPFMMAWAGLGMVVGNIIGGKLSDRYSPSKTILALFITMTFSLLIIHMIAVSQFLELLMTFLIAAIAFALVAPIQMLMIKSSKGSEMLAASVSQACFNIANALGAFLGGLPLVFGYGYNDPELVGAILACTGCVLIFFMMKRNIYDAG